VETCESSYEFLFEPWVLIHLPFKPMLLHQWLVAALAETLQFEIDVSEFFHSPVPASLHKSVRRLAAVLKKLHELILKAFDHLENCTRCRTNKDRRPIIGVLEKLLAPLKFVSGAEGKNMVKALRRKLAGESTEEKMVEVAKESGPPRKFLYSLEFWLGKHETHDPFFAGPTDDEEDVGTPAWMLRSTGEVTEKEFLSFVVALAPPQTPITKQIKTHLAIQFRFGQKLRLVLLKYKFYAEGEKFLLAVRNKINRSVINTLFVTLYSMCSKFK
jgi:hypothetical protein